MWCSRVVMHLHPNPASLFLYKPCMSNTFNSDAKSNEGLQHYDASKTETFLSS